MAEQRRLSLGQDRLRVEGGDHFVALIRVGLNSDGKGRNEINTKGGLKILGEIAPFVNPSTRLPFPGLQDKDLAVFHSWVVEHLSFGKPASPEVLNSQTLRFVASKNCESAVF